MTESSEKKMCHCPQCHKPILSGGQLTAPATFTIRCPWCQTNLQIMVQTKLVAELAHSTTSPRRDPVSELHERLEPLSDRELKNVRWPDGPSDERPLGLSVGRGLKLVGYLYPEGGEEQREMM